MSYSAKILLDSISETGKRLTTFEITFPRIVLAEFNTHRMFSRNSASSRAIPIAKQINRVIENPFVPEQFPVDGRGMQPNSYVVQGLSDYENRKRAWLDARDKAIQYAIILSTLDVHKQICNRLLEPFMWHTVIVTATEFDNFFKLRTHPDAQYEIRRIADLMYEAYHAYEDPDNVGSPITFTTSKDFVEVVRPQKLKVGEWHCPLVYEEDINSIKYMIDAGSNLVDITPVQKELEAVEWMKRVSVARCARVSYLTHDGKRDIEKDLELYEKLVGGEIKHMSPFEHVATPYFVDDAMRETYWNAAWSLPETMNEKGDIRSGNFIGWKQYRKEFADENCTNFRKESQ